MTKKTDRTTKRIKRFITAFLLVIALAFCPSFLLVTKAAESDSTWNIPVTASHRVYRYDMGSNRTSASLNFIVNESNYYVASQSLTSYTLPDLTDVDEVILTYSPFTYSVTMTGASSMSPTSNIFINSSLLGNVAPCLYDNLGNRYPLDSANGGTITIADLTDITKLYLNFYGTVKGTQSFGSNSIRYLNILASVSAFDITLSKTVQRTITDSEGTVWTVPEDVENPVVVASSGTVFKQLVDASDLMYFVDDFGRWHLASYTATTANLYEPDGSLYDTVNIKVLEHGYSLPVYISSYPFDSFLYGSLPEMPLEKLSDKADDFEQLDTLRTEFESDSNPYNDLIRYSAEGEPKNNWFTTFDADVWTFDVWSSKRTMEAVDGKNDLYHTHFDEDISYPLTVFTSPKAPYDGYCVVSFPKGFMFKQPSGTNVVEGLEYLNSWWIQTEIKPYLLVQGVRYEISDFPCQFSFQVYEDESFSFTIGYEAHIRSEMMGNVPATVQWKCPIEITPYSVSVWFYTDDDELAQIAADMEGIKDQLQQQTEEAKKQTDALTNYPDAGKMDSDTDNLNAALGDYDSVEKNLFESASSGMSGFDISSSFKFSAGLLNAISFLATIITNIINAMGDFSLLYILGIGLIVIGILLGLTNYVVSSADKSEGVKPDNRPYYVDSNIPLIDDKSKSKNGKG